MSISEGGRAVALKHAHVVSELVMLVGAPLRWFIRHTLPVLCLCAAVASLTIWDEQEYGRK